MTTFTGIPATPPMAPGDRQFLEALRNNTQQLITAGYITLPQARAGLSGGTGISYNSTTGEIVCTVTAATAVSGGTTLDLDGGGASGVSGSSFDFDGGTA